MDDEFLFRTGIHFGKSYEWVKNNDPNYLMWVEKNRPQMLEEVKIVKPKSTKLDDEPPRLKPNLNFDNEHFFLSGK